MTKESRGRTVVLIVEDEAISRRALMALLRACGYEVRAVATGEEALRLLAEGPVPAMALVDLDLPGMNGMDLIRRMERSNPSVMPILVTAASQEKLSEARMDHPVQYVQKPIDFGRLLSVMAQA